MTSTGQWLVTQGGYGEYEVVSLADAIASDLERLASQEW